MQRMRPITAPPVLLESSHWRSRPSSRIGLLVVKSGGSPSKPPKKAARHGGHLQSLAYQLVHVALA